jgi:hypothetical protein
MSYLIVQPSDFTGFFALARNIKTDAVIQDYIDRLEVKAIYQLLGKTLGDLFIADVTAGAPVTAKYLVIFNSFFVQSNGCTYESDGIKSILMAHIFYNYVKDTQNVSTPAGIVSQQVETSDVNTSANAYRFGEKKWNDMLNSWESVQWYCKTYAPTDYPTYDGLKLKPKFSALL